MAAPRPCALCAVALLAMFLFMRLGNGKLIVRARTPAPNPLAFLGRFAEQKRLIAGWLFAVVRSCGWCAYVVYLPIFSLENGFLEQLGGVVSVSVYVAVDAGTIRFTCRPYRILDVSQFVCGRWYIGCLLVFDRSMPVLR